MFYYLYKTTNLINKVFYIGVHSTNDMNDGYMGSGVFIVDEVNKYGPEFFHKRILKTFSGKKEMYEFEEKIVSPYFFKKYRSYNATVGGLKGVFDRKKCQGGSYDQYVEKHGKDGYPEYDDIIAKGDEDYEIKLLYLLYQIMNSSCDMEQTNEIYGINYFQKIGKSERILKRYSQNHLSKKMIFSLYLFQRYYKSIGLSDDYNYSNLSYTSNCNFCDWFVKQVSLILKDVAFHDFIIDDLLKNNLDLVNFIKNIHLDHQNVITNLPARIYMSVHTNKLSNGFTSTSSKIKWLAENNFEELKKRIVPKRKKDKREIEIKKANLGKWWK